jgi:hypothetical protein
MRHALLLGCLVAALAAACADEDLVSAPPRARPPLARGEPASTGQPEATVRVTPSKLLAPVPFPEDLAVVIQNVSCWGCEPNLTSITRAYRDPAGRMRVETLLSMGHPTPADPIFAWRTQAQARQGLAVSDCVGSDCSKLLGIGTLSSPLRDARFSIRRSTDGGVTWTSTPTVSARGALVRRFAGDELLLEETWREISPGVIVEGGYFLFPSGRRISPPPAIESDEYRAFINAVAVGWGNESPPPLDFLWGYTVRGPQFMETRVEWDSRLRPGPPPAHFADRPAFPIDFPGLARVSWADNGWFLLQWSEPGHAGGRWAVPSNRPGDRLRRYAFNEFSGPAAWVLDDINGWPYPRFAMTGITDYSALQDFRTWPFQLARMDTETGDVQPYEAPELEGTRPDSVLLAYAGPFARAIRTGACTEVRSAPSMTAAMLECAANGVLFQWSAPPTVDGAWLGVTTPAGARGWAETRYLEW